MNFPAHRLDRGGVIVEAESPAHHVELVNALITQLAIAVVP